MSLAAGRRLGEFEILGHLGSGGMGEVYRARDTKLGREVAIKVLPEALERDRDRLARIDREARVLASLNHPNVGALFSYEEVEGIRFLAMELVPGATLAERLASGALPLREALDVGRQIAEALEQAHAKSVIHRDLKPANVKVTPEGRVKVLDFGLAKILDGTGDTLTLGNDAATAEGSIAGTAAYMSPEQARGELLDVRTDVWSFGCVLYEMLTGRRAFRGQTFSDTIAAVLEHDADWSQLPESTPASVRTLLRRCLERERRQRVQSIGDARLELEEALAKPAMVSRADSGRSGSKRAWGLAAVAAAVGLTAGLAGGLTFVRDHSVRDPWIPRRLPLPLPKDASVWGTSGLAVSPAGDRIAYVAAVKDSPSIYIQELTAFEPRPLKGTEGGILPVFSPDGRSLAFQSKGFFRRVPAEGGEPISICAAPANALPAWPRDDLILFANQSTGVLSSVSASGGTPEEFVRIDGISIGVEPDPLPNGQGVLITLSGSSGNAVAVLDLGTRRWKRIVAPPARWPHYVPTGHLLYNVTLDPGGPEPAPPTRWVVAPFDLDRLEITGTVVDVLGDLRVGGYEPLWVTPHGSGILAYTGVGASVTRTRSVMEWIDSGGSRTPVDTGGREFIPDSVALSPDGQRLALSIRDGAAFDLWVTDLDRGTWLRLTQDGHSQKPLWSPDGARIAFASGRDEKDLFWVSSDGAGTPELLAKVGTEVLRPTSFSPDGKRLLYVKGTWSGPARTVGVLLYVVDLDGDRASRVLIDAPYSVTFGAFSPDGRWIAYVTLESDEPTLQLRAADLTGRRWALSKESGTGPAWSPTSREVFFQERGRLMTVPVHPDSGPGHARVMLDHMFSVVGWAERGFEVGSGRFLVWSFPRAEGPPRPTRVVVVPDWFDEVRARTERPRQ